MDSKKIITRVVLMSGGRELVTFYDNKKIVNLKIYNSDNRYSSQVYFRKDTEILYNEIWYKVEEILTAFHFENCGQEKSKSYENNSEFPPIYNSEIIVFIERIIE